MHSTKRYLNGFPNIVTSHPKQKNEINICKLHPKTRPRASPSRLYGCLFPGALREDLMWKSEGEKLSLLKDTIGKIEKGDK